MQRYYAVILLLTMSLICAKPGWAGEDDEEIFESELVRMADLASFPLGSNGGDPLSKGDVEVSENRQVEVEVSGAAPFALYTVLFCHFVNPSPSNCITLGTLSTNSEGEGEAELTFPAIPTTLAGSFLLTRGGANQFITGFQFPPAAAAEGGVEVELKGRIASLSLRTNSFQLHGLPWVIVVDTSTRFENVSGFSGLLVGQEVEVKGVGLPDGSILALKIEVEDD